MAQDVVESEFADAVQSGALQWSSIDYDLPVNAWFKGAYGLVSANVVVVRRAGGADLGFDRLDEVWSLVHDEPSFRAYVSAAISTALSQRK